MKDRLGKSVVEFGGEVGDEWGGGEEWRLWEILGQRFKRDGVLIYSELGMRLILLTGNWVVMLKWSWRREIIPRIRFGKFFSVKWACKFPGYP